MYTEEYKIRRRLSTKKWRENNPEKAKAYRKEYEKRSSTKLYRGKYAKAKGLLNAKSWRDKNPLKARDCALKYTYGITLDRYNYMLSSQKGVCAICKNKDSLNKNLCVDHDHETGEVRALLCRSCNSGLGHFKEKIENFESAISYLKYYSTK